MNKPSGARFFAKMVPMAAMLVLFAVMAMPIHEMAHNIVGRWLGAEASGIRGGYVTFDLTGGAYWWGNLSTWEHFLVRISGPLVNSLIFGLLWLMSHWQARYSDWELDTCAVFGMLAVGQFVYAWFDGLGVWTDWGTVVGAIAGVTVPALMYGRRLVRWVFELENG